MSEENVNKNLNIEEEKAPTLPSEDDTLVVVKEEADVFSTSEMSIKPDVYADFEISQEILDEPAPLEDFSIDEYIPEEQDDVLKIPTAVGHETMSFPAPVEIGEAVIEDFNEINSIELKVKKANPENKKSGKKTILVPLLIALGAVLVAAAIIITGALTGWFGLFKTGIQKAKKADPLSDLMTAAANLIKSENFTVDSEKKLTEKDDTTVTSNSKVLFSYSEKNNTITLYSTSEGTKKLLEKDKIYSYSTDVPNYFASINSIDQSAYANAVKAIINDSAINYKELFDVLEFNEIIKPKEVNAFMTSLSKNQFKDENWLYDNLGFTAEDNVYTFDFDALSAFEALIDAADRSGALATSKDELMDAARAEFEIERLKITITVKDKLISKIVLETKSDSADVKLTLTFSAYSKTTIAKSDTDKIKNSAEEWIEAYVCADCGISGGYAVLYEMGDKWYCNDCFEAVSVSDICSSCGTDKDVSDYDGTLYCTDCYEESISDKAVCDECGKEGKLVEYEDGHYCVRCYKSLTKGESSLTTGECDYCSENGELTSYEGYDLCDDCYYKYSICHYCDKLYEYVTPVDGYNMCNNCIAARGYDYCSSCNILTTLPYNILEFKVCTTCYYSHTYCYTCQTLTTYDYCNNGYYFCYSCYYSSLYDYCDNCSAYTTLTKVGSYDVCNSCYNTCSICDNCGSLTSTAVQSNGLTLCQICSNSTTESYGYCENCYAYTTLSKFDRYYVCYECSNKCKICEQCTGLTDDFELVDTKLLCKSCSDYGYCEYCNTLGGRLLLHSFRVCDSCYYDCVLCTECLQLTTDRITYQDSYYCNECYGYIEAQQYKTCEVCSLSVTHYEKHGTHILCYDCLNEYGVCPGCDKITNESYYCSSGYYCLECHMALTGNDFCDLCNTYSFMEEKEGYKVCIECYNSYEKCSVCGIFTNEIFFHDYICYCSDCYNSLPDAGDEE